MRARWGLAVFPAWARAHGASPLWKDGRPLDRGCWRREGRQAGRPRAGGRAAVSGRAVEMRPGGLAVAGELSRWIAMGLGGGVWCVRVVSEGDVWHQGCWVGASSSRQRRPTWAPRGRRNGFSCRVGDGAPRSSDAGDDADAMM
jgi:hypothetical protein